MNVAETVIYLASCAVNGVVPEENKISEIDFEKIFSLASYHVMSAVIAMALESAGCKDDRVKNAISFSVRKNTFFEATNEAVLKRFDEAGIWYMPLKGAVLKNYYPRYGMREMSDHDILFDASRAENVRNIMESLGFTTKYFELSNHDVYYKEPLCNFEMHRGLFGISHDEKFYEYYSDVKKRLIKDSGNNYGYHFSLEDFYVYMTAHEYKHYSAGGTGLRSILDVYVFMRKFGEVLDWDYVMRETAKLGIAEFEEQNRSLAENLFGNQELTDENREMLRYIIYSGAYGNLENSVKNRLKKYGVGTRGKIKYLTRKILPEREKIKMTYPLLCKYKALYPVLVIYRLMKALLMKRREVLREILILWRIRGETNEKVKA